MNKVWSLTVRNLKHYYRDKGAFFFSFLSVFIVVGLYIVFLSDMQIRNIESVAGNTAEARFVIYTWMIGGLLCIPAVSVPMIILTFKVEDAAEVRQNDFLITPVKRTSLMLGYVLAACLAGICLTVLVFLLGELFVSFVGGPVLSLAAHWKLLGLIVLLNISFAGFSFFVTFRLKTNAALTIVNTLLNTLIGFFAGLYFPLGYLSEEIAVIIKVFPLSHAAALFRQIFMEDALNLAFRNTSPSIIEDIRQSYGLDLVIGGHSLSFLELLVSLIAFGLLFYSYSVIILKRCKSK